MKKKRVLLTEKKVAKSEGDFEEAKRFAEVVGAKNDGDDDEIPDNCHHCHHDHEEEQEHHRHQTARGHTIYGPDLLER